MVATNMNSNHHKNQKTIKRMIEIQEKMCSAHFSKMRDCDGNVNIANP